MANEQQLRALEQRVEGMVRDMRTMWQQLKAALQQVRGAYSNGPANDGSGGGGGIFVCAPATSITHASGAPGTGAPGGPVTGVSMYKINSGAYALVTSSASVYNAMPHDTAGAGYVLICAANGDGTYLAVSQACSSF